jgi:hypothetical protein
LVADKRGKKAKNEVVRKGAVFKTLWYVWLLIVGLSALEGRSLGTVGSVNIPCTVTWLK